MKVNAIFGPPGTGKTRTIIERAAENASRKSVFLSFTRAAAQEVLKRAPDAKASTLHSMAYGKMSLSPASIVNSSKMQDFATKTGIPFKTKDDVETQDGDAYAAIYSYAINRMIRLEEAYDRFGRPGTPGGFHHFVESYVSWKNAYGYRDFNDMLTLALSAKYAPIDHLYLDEAQDCTPLQWKLFDRIAQSAADVTVAGDDDQAIFEWSGAYPHGMVDFVEKYDGEVRVLGQSYRVPRRVHELAHDHVLTAIDRRVDKQFNPANRLGRIIWLGDADKVMYDTLTGKDVMILVRDKFRLMEMQKLLHAEFVPYSIEGGVSPYHNQHADAIRGWHAARNGATPTNEQIHAMIKSSAEAGQSWQNIAKKSWKTAFSIPSRLVQFYETADLFAPTTVRLSTIHRAKGMEADKVVVDLTISGRAEEAIYEDRSMEARVLYVALTRCRHDLYLCGDHPLFVDEYDAWN